MRAYSSFEATAPVLNFQILRILVRILEKKSPELLLVDLYKDTILINASLTALCDTHLKFTVCHTLKTRSEGRALPRGT
jgi:hypothetical protein